jgi:hypothetical protein
MQVRQGEQGFGKPEEAVFHPKACLAEELSVRSLRFVVEVQWQGNQRYRQRDNDSNGDVVWYLLNEALTRSAIARQ